LPKITHRLILFLYLCNIILDYLYIYYCCAEKVVSNCLLAGYGKTAGEAIDDFYVSYKELKVSDGNTVPDIDVTLKFDVGSLFNYYGFLNIEGIARLSGIKASVLRQYASGVRTPNERSLNMLAEGLRRASDEIRSVRLRA